MSGSVLVEYGIHIGCFLTIWLVKGLCLGFLVTPVANGALSAADFLMLDDLVLPSSILGTIGAAAILIAYYITKKRRSEASSQRKFEKKTFYRLVKHVTIVNLGLALTLFLGHRRVGRIGMTGNKLIDSQALIDGCAAQSIFAEFFTIALSAWSTNLAFAFYQGIIKGRKGQDIASAFPAFHLFGYGVPFALAVAQAGLQWYGFTLGWCWMPDKWAQWRWLFGVSWMMVGFAYMLGVYIYVLIYRHRTPRSEEDKAKIAAMADPDSRLAKLNFRLRYYLIIYLFTWFWVILGRFYALTVKEPSVFLIGMRFWFQCNEGWTTLMAYGLMYRRELWNWIQRKVLKRNVQGKDIPMTKV